MIKKAFILLSFLLVISLFQQEVLAAPTATPKATPTVETPTGGTKNINEKIDNQINELKEKIASRVAELNLVEKRGVTGIVAEVKGNKITLTDLSGKTRFVNVDEITKFSSGSESSFGLSDLTKGTKINVLGLYNKQSRQLLARFISIAVNPVILSGTISDIDKKNFVVTVATEDQKQQKVDIQSSTKIYAYGKNEGIARYGFSKLETGDRIVAFGLPDKKDPSLFEASRVTALLELPKNPKIVVPELSANPTDEIKTSSKSSKLTPTKKASE